MRPLWLLVLVGLLACDAGKPARPPPEVALKNAPPPGTSEVDQAHVVFTRDALVIDRIGVPVPAPVTTPSQPSQATLRSDDPAVVAVDANGALIGMQPGTTVVRTTAGSGELRVSVVGGEAFRIVPAAVELRPGQEAPVAVESASGAPIPAEAVRWSIPPGAPVAVVGGKVISLGGLGRYEVEARIGEVRAKLPVAVSLASTERLLVSPARARVRAGQVASFQLFGQAGDLRADWTSSRPEVVASMGGGLFQALKSGKAKVCASAFERVSCSEVEVKP